MNPTPIVKVGLFGLIAITVIAATIGFGVMHTDDLDPRIRFSLLDHTGVSVTEENFRGHYLLAYFGFTHCPEVCPTQMAKLTQIVRRLDALAVTEPITPLFISVDPERDTVARVGAYLKHFHVRFVGLTGSRDALDRTARSFQSYLSAQPSDTSDNYDVVHTSVLYLVDPSGRLVDHVPVDANVENATDRIKEHLL